MSTRVAAPAELRLDVSASLPFRESLHLAASVHLPALATGTPRAVLVCWPGGSYARAYWDMHIDGHPGYSFADHMAAQGYVVVAADHLGVGASSKPSDGDPGPASLLRRCGAAGLHAWRKGAVGQRRRRGGRRPRCRRPGSAADRDRA